MNATTKNQTNQAKDQANQAADKGQEALDKGREAAAHAGAAVGDAARAVGSAVGQKAEDATAAVGTGLQKAADTVRDNTPDKGVLGTASKTVANALDSAGHYVEDKNLTGMMDDVTGLIKRNPIPALLIGVGVGFMIGRLLTSTSRS